MSAKRGNILLVVVCLITLAALAAAGYFFWQNQQLQSLTDVNPGGPNIPAPSATLSLTPNETANWKTYTDREVGLEFKYPSERNIQQAQRKYGKVLFITSNQPIDLITIYTSNDPSIVSNYGKKNSNGGPLPPVMEVKIDNQEAIKYSVVGSTTVQFLLGKYSIEVVYFQASETNSKLIDQILSTFKFTNTTISPTPEPTTAAKKLTYFLPSGWKTVQDTSGTFEVGYDPSMSQLFTGANGNSVSNLSVSVTLGGTWQNNPVKKVGYNFSIAVKPYDGGSRHNFILGTSQWDKSADYHEKDYSYNGWNCLVLYGTFISQSDTNWGMCIIDTKRAFAFSAGTWTDQMMEQLISTIRLLK